MPTIPNEVITAAKATQTKYHIPASVTIAQWAIESGWGKSMSGKFNYGGITAKVKDAIFPYVPGTPLEPATLCWTHEQYKNERVACQRWFKDFDSLTTFFNEHSRLLGTAKVYALARAKLPDRNAFIDAFGPIYATDPSYSKTIKSVIASNKLAQYD